MLQKVLRFEQKLLFGKVLMLQLVNILQLVYNAIELAIEIAVMVQVKVKIIVVQWEGMAIALNVQGNAIILFIKICLYLGK